MNASGCVSPLERIASYFPGRCFWNYDYEIHFDGNTDKAVSASDILELVPHTTDRYDMRVKRYFALHL